MLCQFPAFKDFLASHWSKTSYPCPLRYWLGAVAVESAFDAVHLKKIVLGIFFLNPLALRFIKLALVPHDTLGEQDGVLDHVVLTADFLPLALCLFSLEHS